MPHDGSISDVMDRTARLGAHAEDLAEASTLIDLLTDALTRIAGTTTDARARELASEALAEFHGK